jgi:hypothetical protein
MKRLSTIPSFSGLASPLVLGFSFRLAPRPSAHFAISRTLMMITSCNSIASEIVCVKMQENELLADQITFNSTRGTSTGVHNH